MHPLSSWVFFQNRESSYKRMVYEILLYLHEIGFRSVLDGQSGEKSSSQGGAQCLPGGSCSPAMGGSPGNLENHLDQNYIKLSHTKDKRKCIHFNHDLKLYMLIEKYPGGSEVLETNMGTMNVFDGDFYLGNINCQLHWLSWKWTCT